MQGPPPPWCLMLQLPRNYVVQYQRVGNKLLRSGVKAARRGGSLSWVKGSSSSLPATGRPSAASPASWSALRKLTSPRQKAVASKGALHRALTAKRTSSSTSLHRGNTGLVRLDGRMYNVIQREGVRKLQAVGLPSPRAVHAHLGSVRQAAKASMDRVRGWVCGAPSLNMGMEG